MHQKLTRTLVVLGTAAALAAPVAAGAKKGGNGKGHGPDRAATKGPKAKTVILKGEVVSVDGSTVAVLVRKGNSRGRAYASQQLLLDIATARVTVEDANGDGLEDAQDIAAGDRFVAQVRVPRGTQIDPATALVTRRFVDQGPPEVEEEDEDETETEDEQA